jgi:CubicO group peptidase (beta-lactamase class C family)
MLFTPGYRKFLSERGFGHDGFGGQTGFADPETEIGFAYLSNYLMSGEEEHDRMLTVLAALEKAVHPA